MSNSTDRNPLRVMPRAMDLGRHYNSTMSLPMMFRRDCSESPDQFGRRRVMGFSLPEWQRPLVWTEGQMVRFIESAWHGLYLGTFTYNQVHDHPQLDDLLIDGQQRMYALERYLDDAFPVFGYRWSQVTKVDRRAFDSTVFPSYVTQSTDETYLREYYDRMNFGGTAHTEDQRASEASK